MYSCFWLMKEFAQDNQDNQDDWAIDPDSWAITIAHAIISSTFIVYVLGLDIAAVIFRDRTPEYLNEGYNLLLFRYPGTVFFWDIIAVIITAILIAIALAVMCHCCNYYIYTKCCTKCCTKQVRAKTCIFLLLKFTGVVPLLVLASHAHYIIIAWITDSLYATAVGINYAIFYVIHLITLKQSCKRTKQCYSWTYSKGTCRKVCYGCFVVLAVPSVWVVSLSFQVLVTVFFVYIPIYHSIENTPSMLLTIIQGVGVVFLGLITWQVIVDPRGKGPLSTISGALQKAICMEQDHNCKLRKNQEWVRFDDEEKLAEVLHHVIKLHKPPPQAQ